MNDILRPLAEAKTNVKAGAAAAAGGGRYGMMLWVTQASHEKAAKALGTRPHRAMTPASGARTRS